MNDVLSKIENFLFDIIGLALPGLVYLAILISPVLLNDVFQNVELNQLYPNLIVPIKIFALKQIVSNYSIAVQILIFIVIGYILGHVIKVFSIIKYEILSSIFDKFINKLFIQLFLLIKYLINRLYNVFRNKDLFSTKFYKWFKDFFYPVKNNLIKLFVFKPEDYFSDNEILKTKCVEIINSKTGINYPDKWYSIYKFSTVITNQENIKSLSSNFLAKYNLYRSLAFIFLFTFFYYTYIFKKQLINVEINNTICFLKSIWIILWFTFHYKFKRYWTLCGNETLVSMFYFLTKNKPKDA